jgi:predicted nucleotidyltransferase component of viral defense system
MNAEAVKARIRNLSKKNAINPQALMQIYFMDQFLLRVTKSEFKDNIIIKGGMLIVALFGVGSRSTMDLDVALKNYNLDRNSAVKLFESITAIEIGDGCSFIFDRIEQIMDGSEYQGYRVFFEGRKEKITQFLHLDLSTGDKITPKEVLLNYNTLLTDKVIQLKVYNIETVLAEKIETVYSRGEANTRMKDYYDIFMIHKIQMEKIDIEIARAAFKSTVIARQTEYIFEMHDDILRGIMESEELKEFWEKYRKSYAYAISIKFQDCLDAINEIARLVIE